MWLGLPLTRQAFFHQLHYLLVRSNYPSIRNAGNFAKTTNHHLWYKQAFPHHSTTISRAIEITTICNNCWYSVYCHLWINSQFIHHQITMCLSVCISFVGEKNWKLLHQMFWTALLGYKHSTRCYNLAWLQRISTYKESEDKH